MHVILTLYDVHCTLYIGKYIILNSVYYTMYSVIGIVVIGLGFGNL